jgi:hypothetical protein
MAEDFDDANFQLSGRSNPKWTWRGELTNLLLVREENGDLQPTYWLGCLVNFVKHWSRGKGSKLPEIGNLEAVDQALQQLVPQFINDIAPDQDCLEWTAAKLLEVLETRSRFPILAYYFWNALDGSPKSYLLVPVWSSPENAVKYWPGGQIKPDQNDAKCSPHVGLALCAVLPQTELDYTLQNDVGPNMASASPRDLVEFLRLLARPLVALNFYAELREQLLELRRKEVTVGIMARNLSHNIGSHVLANARLFNSLGFSDGNKSHKEIVDLPVLPAKPPRLYRSNRYCVV